MDAGAAERVNAMVGALDRVASARLTRVSPWSEEACGAAVHYWGSRWVPALPSGAVFGSPYASPGTWLRPWGSLEPHYRRQYVAMPWPGRGSGQCQS